MMVLDFLRWLFTTKDAQDGFRRLVRVVAVYVLFPLLALPVVLYITMPGVQVTKAVIAGSVTMLGLGATLARRKRRPRDLTAV
jgi:hypothetical protein